MFFRAMAVFLADRLRITTARLASKSDGKSRPHDEDEIDLDMMDSVSMAAVRFDKVLKRLQGGTASPNESA
jgi:CRP/FNR family cyclic AMP-dependent transcriptional regulator